MKSTKAKKLVLIIIGIIALIFATLMSNADCGNFESSYTYGGDAYTGIQNAAAQTANNIKDLAVITSAGFSFLFALIGLILIAYGIFLKDKPDYTRILNEINCKLTALNNKPEPAPQPVVETVATEAKEEVKEEIKTDVSFTSEEKTVIAE